MRELIVIGRPNSGKTLFTLNFATYLGSKSADIIFCSPDGLTHCRHATLAEAKKELCGNAIHKTRQRQSLILQMPVGKSDVRFKLTDTCGISELIHPEEAIRKGMAQSLSLLQSADFIVHIIDTAAFQTAYQTEQPDIDQEIYRYGAARSRYLLLANKLDLPAGRSNLQVVAAAFPRAARIGISGLSGIGFREVRTFVADHI